MNKQIYTKIIATGSYVPADVVTNEHFLNYTFYDPATGKPFDKSNEEIVRKFYEITNIAERRWATHDEVNSDIAAKAAEAALNSGSIDRESLDFIICCHNFGDVAYGNSRCDCMPSLANRVKKLLEISNPACICHDLISGCPGWTQGMIVANAYLTSKTFTRGLVIGSDLLSRIADPYDRDAMIFSDGAGATVVEAVDSDTPTGIIAHSSRSDCNPYLNLLNLGRSYNPAHNPAERLIKMAGHKVYVYALTNVAASVKDSIDKAGLDILDIKKILIHQANEKMDEAIVKQLFRLYDKNMPDNIMPMSIRYLGNSSTATVPTLLDLIVKNNMPGHEIREGDNIVLCSIGAGMNINSIVYKW
ncbi:MAG: ketoacyl-ACP synthase III [Bacteroidales bacterium]|jgi:3-oxoacyl-[acyl-carrier-protein] synthase-3|nr:ketoacyl-ACP synthase III [Bacteroidales bacterium]